MTRIFFVLMMLMAGIVSAQNKGNKNGSSSIDKNKSEKSLAEVGASLPGFSFLTHDHQVLFDTSFRANTPILLVLFNPSCSHCQEVALKLVELAPELPAMDILFMTGNNLLTELPGFYHASNFEQLSNAYVSIDNSDISKHLFEYKGIPQIMLYSKDRKLVHTWYKELNVKELHQKLNKN